MLTIICKFFISDSYARIIGNYEEKDYQQSLLSKDVSVAKIVKE